MTTPVDICNRALLVLGVKKQIASLTQDSEEAQACNTIYTRMTAWCLMQANWNFARSAAVLGGGVQFTGAPWTTAQPAPPWMFQYNAPGDYLKAQYLFDINALNTSRTAFTGEPIRFVVANKSAATVILTNTIDVGLVYTASIGESLWSPAFELFVVHALAYMLSAITVGQPDFTAALYERMMHMFLSAEQINREEGLMLGDATPEWIQALGIPYPERRFDRRQRKGKANDDGN
jgi:hypothetical protein